MKHVLLALGIASALVSPVAFAQSKGEANYDEQCRASAVSGTAAEQAATRKRCVEEAKKAAKTDVPGAANQPGTPATAGAATKAERDAARKQRRATGAEVAKQPKQDPKNPTN